MAGHGGGDPKKVVLAALAANALIACAKFVAAWLSGSITMLAEGVHSLADTSNQGLLLVGMALALKRDPERFPMGRATESYFWTFIVSLLLFFMGGVYAVYEGVHKLLSDDHGPHGSLVAPAVVLGVSVVMEGISFRVALAEFNRERAGKTIREALFHGKDPTIPLVVLEDAGALIGLVIALLAVLGTWLTGSSNVDGIGSVVIGFLLCGIGLLLARDTHSLLIGEGATPAARARVREAALGTPGVAGVGQILTMHLGPDTVLLAMKVRFLPGTPVEQVETITNSLEDRVRAAAPEMKRIFVEPDSHYDASKDPEYAP